MYKIFAYAFIVLLSAGCSTTSKSDLQQDEPIGRQRLSTNFKRQGISLEWECSWGTGFSAATCNKGEIKAIEVTAYAPSFGNTDSNRETAFDVAYDMALVKLNRFISDEISTSRVTTTLTKNVEKANDRLKSKIGSQEIVRTTDDDSTVESNVATRENANEVVRTVTESITSQSSGIVKGVRAVSEKVVDRQTVAVTVRWDKDSEQAVRELRKRLR